jgi:magnesium-transporting ATPase (P-type)
MDDNFSSIIVAILYGRNVYESVQKFIQFQLTVNIVAVTLAIIGAMLFQASPLGAVQMLWVNLIMDSLASLALATEPPVPRLLNRQPVGRNDAIITSQMYSNMFLQAAYQLIISCIILFRGHLLFYSEEPNVEGPGAMLAKQNEVFTDLSAEQIGGKQLRLGWFAGCAPSQHYTMLFNAFVMMTLFNQFASRKLNGENNIFEGLLSNRPFLVLSVLELGLQILFVQAFGAPVGCSPLGLTGAQWGWCLLFGFIGWIWQVGINFLFKQFWPKESEDDVKVGVVREKEKQYSEREIKAHKQADRLSKKLSEGRKNSFEKDP